MQAIRKLQHEARGKQGIKSATEWGGGSREKGGRPAYHGVALGIEGMVRGARVFRASMQATLNAAWSHVDPADTFIRATYICICRGAMAQLRRALSCGRLPLQRRRRSSRPVCIRLTSAAAVRRCCDERLPAAHRCSRCRLLLCSRGSGAGFTGVGVGKRQMAVCATRKAARVLGALVGRPCGLLKLMPACARLQCPGAGALPPRCPGQHRGQACCRSPGIETCSRPTRARLLFQRQALAELAAQVTSGALLFATLKPAG